MISANDSFPADLLRLGLDERDYVNIGRHIGCLSCKKQSELDVMVDNIDLSKIENWKSFENAVMVLANEKRIYNLAGINYDDGPPMRNLFRVALADYIANVKKSLEKES